MHDARCECMQLRGVNQLQAKTDKGEGVEKWVLFVAILYGQSQGYVQGEYTYLNAQQRELHTSGQSVSQASCHNY